MVRTQPRTYTKPIGMLLTAKDRHDAERKAREQQWKFQMHGQKLLIKESKYYGDITKLDKPYKQFRVPIVQIKTKKEK